MLRILLVEDDDDIRIALARALTKQDDHVAAVASGAEAVARLVTFAPDAVILDLGLPDLDGADVLAMIRSISSVPVLVATARELRTLGFRWTSRVWPKPWRIWRTMAPPDSGR